MKAKLLQSRLVRSMLQTAGVVAMTLIAPTVQADTFPQRPVTLVVGFAPGTGPDSLARLLQDSLARALGQQVVIDNRAGAGGQIGAAHVARSPADGYTLLLGELGSMALSPLTTKRLPYDVMRDFVPVSEVARVDFAFIVPAQRPHTNLNEFADAARKTNGKTLVATLGVGTPGHVAAELFADVGRFAVEPVHFRAPGDALGALASAQVEGVFVSVPFAAAQVKGGRVRAIAQTGSTRSKQLAEVPTAVESGFRDLTLTGWFALFAPKGVPAAVTARVHDAVKAAVQDHATAQKLEQAGFIPAASSPEQARALLESELRRWKVVVDRAAIQITN